MEYPITCNSARERTEYLYCAQELLRNLHNSFSKWHHEGGFLEAQYDNLPKSIKSKYSYVSAKLSKDVLIKFIGEDFTPRSNKITQEICVQRALLKKSIQWSIDIGEV